MSNAEKLLRKIGLTNEQIEKLTKEDATETIVEEIATSFQQTQREVLRNNAEFIQPIKDEIRGAELSKIEHKLKKTFNLGAEEIKDKKFDEIIGIAHEKATKASAVGAEELQSKLVELSKENKRLLEEVLPTKEMEAKQTIAQFKKETALQSILAKRQLIVSSDVVMPAVKTFLESNYNIDLDEKGDILVKTKQNLNPLNQDGTKIVTFEEILDGHLTSLGVVKQSNAAPAGKAPAPGTPPAATPPAGTQGETKFNLPGLQKAQQNAESLAKMRTFGPTQ
jgi:hypothetical protein